ncbi:MAG: ubiquitin-like small modifier protein 1 [Methanocalculus sp.]|uniref:ubiquitin-like small modifier protein 1 n=1 Tax=Methanocalculus sp. TaxID=2004547 RepID=UPI002724D4A9|nr:ubiquitin-like small modifier protein 1 [Methanocalculus sp.]MDO9539944.1 ubiquitin-like small modifier protein 1 [Methanocalculus sp.]
MKITIKAFARFREIFGSEKTEEMAEGSTLAALLDNITTGNQTARRALFEDNGALRGYVILMKNRKRVNREEIAEIILADGDEIALYPPVAGG